MKLLPPNTICALEPGPSTLYGMHVGTLMNLHCRDERCLESAEPLTGNFRYFCGYNYIRYSGDNKTLPLFQW